MLYGTQINVDLVLFPHNVYSKFKATNLLITSLNSENHCIIYRNSLEVVMLLSDMIHERTKSKSQTVIVATKNNITQIKR